MGTFDVKVHPPYLVRSIRGLGEAAGRWPAVICPFGFIRGPRGQSNNEKQATGGNQEKHKFYPFCNVCMHTYIYIYIHTHTHTHTAHK